MTIAVGNVARVKQPVLQGEVINTRYNHSAGELEHLVSYNDASGDEQVRWFLESQLEAVDAQ